MPLMAPPVLLPVREALILRVRMPSVSYVLLVTCVPMDPLEWDAMVQPSSPFMANRLAQRVLRIVPVLPVRLVLTLILHATLDGSNLAIVLANRYVQLLQSRPSLVQ